MNPYKNLLEILNTSGGAQLALSLHLLLTGHDFSPILGFFIAL